MIYEEHIMLLMHDENDLKNIIKVKFYFLVLLLFCLLRNRGVQELSSIIGQLIWSLWSENT